MALWRGVARRGGSRGGAQRFPACSVRGCIQALPVPTLRLLARIPSTEHRTANCSGGWISSNVIMAAAVACVIDGMCLTRPFCLLSLPLSRAPLMDAAWLHCPRRPQPVFQICPHTVPTARCSRKEPGTRPLSDRQARACPRHICDHSLPRAAVDSCPAGGRWALQRPSQAPRGVSFPVPYDEGMRMEGRGRQCRGSDYIRADGGVPGNRAAGLGRLVKLRHPQGVHVLQQFRRGRNRWSGLMTAREMETLRIIGRPSLDAGKVMTTDDIDSRGMLLAGLLARVGSIDFGLAKVPTDDRGGCGVDRASNIPARWRCAES